nr:uncharacterized protein LOC111425363 [Onthophagus taurus]
MAQWNLSLLLFITITMVSTSNIFDILSSPDAENREDPSDKTCLCKGPGCMCCVDFNFTYVHLGGPGCVQMEYISQDEGISVNVSYGERILHAQQVKGPNPPPTCMTLVKNIAEICARFTTLEKYEDGLKGCLVIEPKVLRDIQTQIDISCFVMGPNGMKLDNNSTVDSNDEESDEITTEATETEIEELDFNEDAILAAVSETAQKGLTFFSNFLGIDLRGLAANITAPTDKNVIETTTKST